MVELRAASKILHAAVGSFSTNMAYDLARVGGPLLVRPVAVIHASRVRAALKTFSEL